MDSPQSAVSKLTPWEVNGKIDYMAQINHFGTKPINGDLIKKMEQITGIPVPSLIRRGLVYSHIDLDILLESVTKGIPMYIYTGRGPSANKMHLGHLIPFKLALYLQKAFNCIVIIQMSDDEKYLFKDGSGPIDLDKYRTYSYENARDIIAFGFDLNKTLIFSDLAKNIGDLFFNNILIMKQTSMATIKAIYGLGETLPESIMKILSDELAKELELTSDIRDLSKIDELTSTIKKFNCSAASIGQCVWPVFQSGPAFCTSFKDIFARSILHALKTNKELPTHIVLIYKKILKELTNLGSEQSIICVVPMALDQAPYFRMARDVASVLKCPKPVAIHSEFLPGLQQSNTNMHSKMGTSDINAASSTIFLDMSSDQIKKTITRYAFSGGRDTLSQHQQYGGDIRVDICYQYLTFFLEDDIQLRKIAEEYTSGKLSSADLKVFTANIVITEIKKHQNALKNITDDIVKDFFNLDRIFDIGGCYKNIQTNNIINNEYDNYDNYGINFDRTFGFSCKLPS